MGDSAEDIIGMQARELGLRTLVVGGEPGGGIPGRPRPDRGAWGASCREVLGNSDIATIVWAECEAGDGMHFIGQDLVLAEMIDPQTGKHVEPVAGAIGELVYSALRREASALLRFSSGDIVEVIGDSCACGRTSFRLHCFGRTDDMLLVRGINVWPTAVQEMITAFRPADHGRMRIVADFDGHSPSARCGSRSSATRRMSTRRRWHPISSVRSRAGSCSRRWSRSSTWACSSRPVRPR